VWNYNGSFLKTGNLRLQKILCPDQAIAHKVVDDGKRLLGSSKRGFLLWLNSRDCQFLVPQGARGVEKNILGRLSAGKRPSGAAIGQKAPE
jgi:hypothetical protein